MLNELATSAGLLRQKRWSLSLPEATARTLVLTMESQSQSAGELQDVLRWKIERGFGLPIEELSIVGFAAVVKQLPKILRLIRQTVDAVTEAAPDILVIIDSPDFTHRVARRVR